MNINFNLSTCPEEHAASTNSLASLYGISARPPVLMLHRLFFLDETGGHSDPQISTKIFLTYVNMKDKLVKCIKNQYLETSHCRNLGFVFFITFQEYLSCTNETSWMTNRINARM